METFRQHMIYTRTHKPANIGWGLEGSALFSSLTPSEEEERRAAHATKLDLHKKVGGGDFFGSVVDRFVHKV